MANSHMQRNSTSFVIKELQFIIIVRWYYMPFKMANIKKKKADNIHCWQGYRATRKSHSLLVWMQNSIFWRRVWPFLIKLDVVILSNGQTCLLIWKLYPYKKNQHVNIYTNLIHNFQNWKQPKCPSVSE